MDLARDSKSKKVAKKLHKSGKNNPKKDNDDDSGQGGDSGGKGSSLDEKQRRDGDSNPGYPVRVHTLSKRAP